MTVQDLNQEGKPRSGFLSIITDKLRNQMVLAFLIASLVPLLFFSLLAYNRVSDTFRADNFQTLEAIRAIKANQLTNYFDGVANQTHAMAISPTTIEAMHEFNQGAAAAETDYADAFANIDNVRAELSALYGVEFTDAFDNPTTGQMRSVEEILSSVDAKTIVMQHQYIYAANELLKSGEAVALDDDHDEGSHTGGAHQTGDFFLSDGSSSAYDTAHQAYHGYFIEVLHSLDFDDMLLVSAEGDVVYTHLKSLEFMTSLVNGPYKDTHLARAFQAAVASDSEEFTTLVDYEPYQPALGEPASFIAAPIFDGDTKLGVLIFQISLDAISAITQERSGLGESGETYLVGSDNLWRNDSRFLDQLGVDSTILNPEFTVETVAVQSAQSGQLGTQVIDDYRGVPVLSSWQPLVIQEADGTGHEPITWALMAEIDDAEVRSPLNSLAGIGLGSILFLGLFMIPFALVFAGFLTRQTDLIVDVFAKVRAGDLDNRVNVISNDEVGQLATGFNSLLDRLQGTLTSVQSERDDLQVAIANLLDEVSDVAEGDLTIEADISSDSTGAIADSINYMLEQLRTIILQVKETTLAVSSSATEIQATAEHLANGSEQQAAQIIETSSAIDEMSVSIQKVSENTQLSNTVGLQARDSARKGTQAVEDTIEGMIRIRQNVSETSKRIKNLGESSQEIGEIVDLIRNITNRTAILALNASIQAARAGEAGRSFVVVAEEIERLSERSAEATRQIADLVKTIQSETNLAVGSMEATTNEVVIGSKLANEAGIALLEIDTVSDRLTELIQSTSEAAQQQAISSEAIAHSMNDIAGVTQQTASGTKQASVSIYNLAQLADELRQSVSAFKLDEDEMAMLSSANGEGLDEATGIYQSNAVPSLN